jgi:hypothetical protein
MKKLNDSAADQSKLDDGIRITEIFKEQKSLIERFQMTKNKIFFTKFQTLSGEFLRIHQDHQRVCSEKGL